MLFSAFQPVCRIARLSCGVALSLLCTVGLSGCGTVNNSTTPIGQLRIVDATPDAGGVDIYAGSTALTYNLGFGTVTSYVPVAPSTYTLSADTSGTRTALTSVKATLANAKQYTLLISNVAAALQSQVLTDQSQAAPTGQISLRFLNEATLAGAIDLYLVPSGTTVDKVNPLQAGLPFGANTGYVNVPVGTYTLYVEANGTVVTSTAVSLYTGPSTAYPAGSARTIVLLDQLLITSPAVQVMTLSDFDSATATQ
jgi:hypothetical protein